MKGIELVHYGCNIKKHHANNVINILNIFKEYVENRENESRAYAKNAKYKYRNNRKENVR
jgi:hypothetical protein